MDQHRFTNAKRLVRRRNDLVLKSRSNGERRMGNDNNNNCGELYLTTWLCMLHERLFGVNQYNRTERRLMLNAETAHGRRETQPSYVIEIVAVRFRVSVLRQRIVHRGTHATSILLCTNKMCWCQLQTRFHCYTPQSRYGLGSRATVGWLTLHVPDNVRTAHEKHTR